jgi:2,4-dienoyl-CoA reductase (NADPH2)
MRFPLAVASAVREASGAGQAVVYRISGADLVPGGAEAEDVLRLARRLAGGSVDALNVGVGWHEARVPTVQATVPHGAWAPWARAIREVVGVPVIASNRINTVALAHEVIAAGDADFVSLARPFLADPEIVAKSRRAPSRPINVCIACNDCIDNSIFDRRVSCVVNPRAGFELEAPGPGGARQLRPPVATVAVVGGGPAGLEAARSLATAGYAVELFEGAQRLGGQFRMACRVPGKEDFGRTIEYFEHELAALGVSVWLDTRVAQASVLSAFDAVVVATGVRPREVAVPGVELPHVRSYASVLLDDGDGAGCGDEVAIIGAGGIGVDVAHLLSAPGAGLVSCTGERVEGTAERVEFCPPGGNDSTRSAFYARYGLQGAAPIHSPPRRAITLMRRGGRIGEGIGPSTRWVAVQELEQAGVELLTGVHYERIEPDAVVVTTDEGGSRRIAAQTVIVAAGQEPETALLAALADAGVPRIAVGGAAGTERLNAGRAFREGFEAPGAVASALGLRGRDARG